MLNDLKKENILKTLIEDETFQKMFRLVPDDEKDVLMKIIEGDVTLFLEKFGIVKSP